MGFIFHLISTYIFRNNQYSLVYEQTVRHILFNFSVPVASPLHQIFNLEGHRLETKIMIDLDTSLYIHGR